jgi:hypothetical protein
VNIEDDFKTAWKKNRAVNYAFDFNGKNYATKLEMNTDWLDPQFFEIIKNAIRENQVIGEFHYCFADGPYAGYIFLTPEQYRFPFGQVS